MRITLDDWYWQALSRIVTYKGVHVRAIFWSGYWWTRLAPNLYELLNHEMIVIS